MRRVLLLLVLVAGVASAGGLPEEGDNFDKLRRQFAAKDMACWKGKVEACEWVAAFFRVELAVSDAACERGDGNACHNAARHYGWINDGAWPEGVAPEADRAKQAYYYLRACEHGVEWRGDRDPKRWIWTNDVGRGAVIALDTPQGVLDAKDCVAAADLVADGAFGVFDLATAETIYRRACDLAGEPHETCPYLTSSADWLQFRRAESPEARVERIRRGIEWGRSRVEAQRDQRQQDQIELAADRAERWDVAMGALESGITTGLAQNAAVQGSLDASADGIGDLVAESDRLAAEREATERAAEERRRQVWAPESSSDAGSSPDATGSGSGGECPPPKSYNCWGKCVGTGDEAPKICPAM